MWQPAKSQYQIVTSCITLLSWCVTNAHCSGALHQIVWHPAKSHCRGVLQTSTVLVRYIKQCNTLHNPLIMVCYKHPLSWCGLLNNVTPCIIPLLWCVTNTQSWCDISNSVTPCITPLLWCLTNTHCLGVICQVMWHPDQSHSLGVSQTPTVLVCYKHPLSWCVTNTHCLGVLQTPTLLVCYKHPLSWCVTNTHCLGVICQVMWHPDQSHSLAVSQTPTVLALQT